MVRDILVARGGARWLPSRITEAASRESQYSAQGSPNGLRTAPLLKLELVPEELVVDLVVELHFLRLHDAAEEARAAVRGRLLQVGVAALYVLAQQFGGPLGLAKIRHG